MKVLIIGGSGFVSGTLARLAVEAGHAVWAVTRGERPLSPGVTGITVDRKSREDFAAAIRSVGVGWDLVVDSIGYLPADAEQDAELFLSSDEAICGHFVFISTDFVYHPESRIIPQPEGATTYLESGYGHEKRACELVLQRAKRDCWTVFRPCHIYGPGSLIGCLPDHGRDAKLIERIHRREPLALVGAGVYLQQPLFAPDLGRAILSCAVAPAARGRICNIAGPEIIESRRYYEIIGEIVGEEVRIEELPVLAYRSANPDKRSFLCHRIYALDALARAGIAVPATGTRVALERHVASLVG